MTLHIVLAVVLVLCTVALLYPFIVALRNRTDTREDMREEAPDVRQDV